MGTPGRDREGWGRKKDGRGGRACYRHTPRGHTRPHVSLETERGWGRQFYKERCGGGGEEADTQVNLTVTSTLETRYCINIGCDQQLAELTTGTLGATVMLCCCCDHQLAWTHGSTHDQQPIARINS
ncbi:hypothetical protein ElyMa_003166900 [Elysia marginata]|uniref:Uncharacterized protein n=1 Tax=Elysia marginata TaxID=1093978 RepID=A0AAV4IWV5_9GAST|nr:hypothetical protein ElyMa_003166900 [Elysia marginata]